MFQVLEANKYDVLTTCGTALFNDQIVKIDKVLRESSLDIVTDKLEKLKGEIDEGEC